jgi:hypothetical protein
MPESRATSLNWPAPHTSAALELSHLPAALQPIGEQHLSDGLQFCPWDAQ